MGKQSDHRQAVQLDPVVLCLPEPVACPADQAGQDLLGHPTAMAVPGNAFAGRQVLRHSSHVPSLTSLLEGTPEGFLGFAPSRAIAS